MSALRLSEQWFRRGLWLVALVFAGFLIGLGDTIMGDLPKVEESHALDDFMDRDLTPKLRQAVKDAQRASGDAQDALDQAQLKQKAALADNRAARETFSNWLATRHATARKDQDRELIERSAQLDALRKAEREALASVELQQQAALDAGQAEKRAQTQLRGLEEGAQEAWSKAMRAQDLRIFLYRLMLTLPLLAIAAWLFAKKRKGAHWPFVWGFILFALFAFFVELVPYLPSYGGYVRYVVGILVAAVAGRYGIEALNRYLARQAQSESQPDQKRRVELGYDIALTRLGKGVCPGCERKVDLQNEANDFCPHCGIGLHLRCGHCQTRKSAFSRFCHTCGTKAEQSA